MRYNSRELLMPCGQGAVGDYPASNKKRLGSPEKKTMKKTKKNDKKRIFRRSKRGIVCYFLDRF